MKRTLRFLPLAAAACAALLPPDRALADYPSTVLSYSPVAYWRFNETVASPAPSTVADSSGNNLTGFPLLGATLGGPGIVGNAALLSNPGLVVGNCITRIDIPNSAIVDRNAPFSVEFWMNPSAINADATGLCPVSSFTPYYYGSDRSGWLFYVNSSGQVNFRLGGEGSYIPGGNISSAAGSVVAGTWTHVVGTYDGGHAQLFINGVLAASAATGSGFNPNNWSMLRIGGSPLPGSVDTYQGATSGNRGWDGGVDELAVYSNILSAATVAAHYAAATTNNSGYHAQILADQPVGYWELEEPAYTAPSTNSYPSVGNVGSAGADAAGVLTLGASANQAGSGYAGFGSGNSSASFDGESGSLSLLVTNNPPELTFSGTPITLMAWIKSTEIGGWRTVIAQGWDPTSAQENYLRIGDTVDWEGQGLPDVAYYEMGTFNGGAGNITAAFPVPAGDVGNWVFLAGTWDGSFWNLYRNGVLVAQTADESGPASLTDPWSVGSRSNPDLYWGWNFSGSIDEAAIFNTALTADQIQALYVAAEVPPVFTQVPVSPGTVYAGSSITFSAVVEGNPTLVYQWKKGSTPLSGQNGPTLTLDNLAVSDSGTYTLTVNNAFGSASASVSLNVIPGPPVILTPPASETRWSGFQFGFAVEAGGTAPLSYQWSLNNTPIPGANSSTYTNIASAADAGTYTCVVTNSVGSATTSATLTVLAQTSGYVSTILGDGPIAYWRLNETGGTVAHDYVGGNDGLFNNVEIGQPGYNVFDTNSFAVKFNGVTDSDIVDIDGTKVNFTGTSAEFSIEAWVNGPAAQAVAGAAIIVKGTGSNGGTADEQFELGLTSANQYTVFSRGTANNSYGATAAVGPNSTWQHVVGVYDSAGGSITVYVNGQVSGTPSTTLVPGGVHLSTSPISIGAERSGTTPVWDLAFEGLISDVAVYPVALTPDQILAHYQATYGTTTPPHITLQPLSVTNYVGLPASFTVGALGSVPLTYQWKKNNTPISGATDQSYSIASLALSDAGNYTVTVANGAGTSNSVIATLTVLAAPATPPAIEGLVLHLPFDNNLTDTTGRGNNATNQTKGPFGVSGTVGFVPGLLGEAYSYETDESNGNYTNSFYATLGLRPDLQFSSNVNFTVSYWVQLPANYTEGDLPFLTDTVGSTFGTGLVLAPTYGTDATQGAGTVNGGWAMSVIDHGGNGLGVYGAVGSINDGNWHSLVQVFDRTAGFTCYLDGQVASFTVEGGTGASEIAAGDIDTGAPFNIGQDPTGVYPENGSASIDDLAIWRKALTPLEAASIYVAGLNAVPVGTNSFIKPLVATKLPGGQLQLSWSAGALQSAPTAKGPYTDTGAKSPYTVSDATGSQFFRTKL